MIESYIARYLPGVNAAPLRDAHFDTAARLIACAGRSDWSREEFELLEFLCKRVEISRCLYESYLANGRRASTRLLPAQPSVLALLVLLKDMTRLLQLQAPSGAIKRLNAALKLRDSLKARQVELDKDLLAFVDTCVAQFFEQHTSSPANSSTASFSTPATVTALPITVLFWEGPIARAYLATLKDMGLRPEKIIQLVSANDLASKKPVGRFLPGALRLAYAQSRQRNSIHHWSGVLQRTETALYQGMRREVESTFEISAKVIDDALALRDLNEYSSDVEQLLVNDLADERLQRRLEALPSTQILFTGGGIVPKQLLELQHLRFIHVHPGFLPEVRGADCALWSQLMKGCTSATCFYMAPGIDDGDVIHAAWLPPLGFRMDTSAIELKSLYRATYAFFDPWIRASVLRQATALTQGFTNVAVQPQIEEDSVTYHFMHERIQSAAFEALFQKAE
ncbi:MAG TPA: formyltransferase family protein [Pseudomonas sp.]